MASKTTLNCAASQYRSPFQSFQSFNRCARFKPFTELRAGCRFWEFSKRRLSAFLGEGKKRHRAKLFGFCLMLNHFHLVLEPAHQTSIESINAVAADESRAPRWSEHVPSRGAQPLRFYLTLPRQHCIRAFPWPESSRNKLCCHRLSPSVEVSNCPCRRRARRYGFPALNRPIVLGAI